VTDTNDRHEFNRKIIDEFRANDGVVTGMFAGAPMILVNHVGAKSGKAYTSPLVYTRDGDNYVVIASKGGAPEDPQWFGNLVANPDITVEVGTDTIPGHARVAEGEERDRLFGAQAELMPNFADYATKTSRQIPVVVLEPR
jgi:deazaflavin-dependent oxidoreductase (nitroreductase family)